MRACGWAPLAIVFMMLQIFPSAEAHGQRLAGTVQPVPAAAEITLPGAVRNRTGFATLQRG
jgi:hypothetical protein